MEAVEGGRLVERGLEDVRRERRPGRGGGRAEMKAQVEMALQERSRVEREGGKERGRWGTLPGRWMLEMRLLRRRRDWR